MYRQGTSSRVMTVANTMPKAREMAMGTMTWAWAERSSSIGARPMKVVTEVSMMARKRRRVPSTTAA